MCFLVVVLNSICGDVRTACMQHGIEISKCSWGGYNNGVIYHIVVCKSGRLSWDEIMQYQWICNVPTYTVHQNARFLREDLTGRGGILKVLTFLQEHLNYELSEQNSKLCELFANNGDKEVKDFLSKLNNVSISGNIKPILCLIDETKTQSEMKNLLAQEYKFRRPKKCFYCLYTCCIKRRSTFNENCTKCR